jgi:multidrug resistance protein MdtO
LAAQGSALRPVLAELEHVVALLQQALRSDATAPNAGVPARRSLFVADAFTNPEYARYALKGGLAVLLAYLIQSAVDWPGIRTCVITCMMVALTSEGATIQKGTLRLAGALVGGALGFLSILLFVPWMESIASLALLVAAAAPSARGCISAARASRTPGCRSRSRSTTACSRASGRTGASRRSATGSLASRWATS